MNKMNEMNGMNSKNRKEIILDFYEKLKEGLQLGEIKKVQWDIKGEDCMFKPERTAVRIEDTDGKVFELVIHNPHPHWESTWRNEEEVILNTVLATHGVIPAGMWIGVNCDLSQMVNACRKQFPKEFISNEEECELNPWLMPRYRF